MVKTFVETADFSKWQPRFCLTMPTLNFRRSLSPIQAGAKAVIAKSKRKPLAERLKAGLTEAAQCAKGELNLRTVQIPDPPPEIPAKEVSSLRAKVGMSQAVFARVLNVSTKTVQSWEQGERKPSHAALRMLQVFGERPDVCFPDRRDSGQSRRPDCSSP